ncbi:GTP cyclohydrolase II [Bacillus arachidis]|uniref:GTP cyclohydrolase II n=1 Tax=Bacillus arachidis TaxID=2819290 RepID=UPI00255CCE25|nr:GTP cyclohydrolase II [Bacillus arachidis]WIY58763.1 GTP cyclohydrolase II [Bacillus arachidis]
MIINIEHYEVLSANLNIIKMQNTDEYIYLFGPVDLPIYIEDSVVNFKWYTWFKQNEKWSKEELINKLPALKHNEIQQSSILTYGDIENDMYLKVRFHSICHTGDIFGSQKCDCGAQLRSSLKKIYENNSGALFYLSNHEGRGIGLFSKAMAYSLQQRGLDTVEANLALGHGEDTRNYTESVEILKYLRSKPIILLTNNPTKIDFLTKNGIEVLKSERIIVDYNEHNKKYIKAKVDKMKHIIKL